MVVLKMPSSLQDQGASSNLTGEGFVTGGLYVVRSNGVAELSFSEANLGDTTLVSEVLEACKRSVIVK